MSRMDDPVEIVPYDPRWPDAFEIAARELRPALHPWLVAIEHIGSTAVPGLAAKPVIDIQVGVRSLDQSKEIVAAVETLGYEYVPDFEVDFPRRRYFRRWTRGRRSHQVHLVERANTDWWDRHIAFRDWLRTHPTDRDAYAALKQRLAAEHADNRVTYTDQKTEFVRAIEERALSTKADPPQARRQVGGPLWPAFLVGLDQVRVLEVARGGDGRPHVAAQRCARCG